MDFSVELNPKWFDGEMLEILGDGNTPTFGDASIAPFQKTKASPTSSQHQSCASPKKAPHLQVEEELEQFSVELNPTAPFQKTKGCDRLVAGGETVTKNGKRSLPDHTLITRGSFHQGHDYFGSNKSKQCATNSTTAIMTNAIHNARTWSTSDIDGLLINGDKMYTFMKQHDMISDVNGSGYVFVRELPTKYTLDGNTFTLQYLDTFTGHVNIQEYDRDLANVAMPLDKALQRALDDNDACLITIMNSTCAVLKHESGFSVFDPHARGDDGGLDLNGSSILAHHATVDSLNMHITNLVQSLCGNDELHNAYHLIEATGVKVVSDGTFSARTGGMDTDSVALHDSFANIETVKQHSKDKYANDPEFQENVKQYSKDKYANDPEFQENVKQHSKDKYANDPEFQENVKQYSKAMNVERYRNNSPHRKRIKLYHKELYNINIDHAISIKDAVGKRRNTIFLQKHNIDFVINQFKIKVQSGPTYVCCVCHKLLFKHQVVKCNLNQYRKSALAESVAKKCITYTYVHTCGNSCEVNCHLQKTTASMLWICHTCNNKILRGVVPEDSAVNNLHPDPIPEELDALNSLEQHLIAQHIPFMKLLALPKGGQNGVHGPVTCVPSSSDAVCNILPRLDDQDLMIRVKLKRKLTFKGHYEYQYVNTQKVHNALNFLKAQNKWYTDVHINNEWSNPLEKVTIEEACGSGPGQPACGSGPGQPACGSGPGQPACGSGPGQPACGSVDVPEHYTDNQHHGMYLDTCLQPVDIAQEILDNHFESILSVAPAEGNSPVRLLSDIANEAKCFPVLFPKGTGTFHEQRDHRITLAKYLKSRILNADGRFGKNLEYIFYAQYLSEINQVVSNVSIALRKGYQGQHNTDVASSSSNNPDFLKDLLNYDMGYKFLKPIRGTPVFWQGVQKDLMAMVRTLGIPTFFMSFSSADLRWPEFMEAFMYADNVIGNIADMEWTQKCDLLKNNPVTAARMFDHRFHCLLKEVIMSPAQPIGKVIDYFYRVEFQQRGSCHTHCLFWVESPKIGVNTNEEVITFIDKYVTCELPPESDPMHEVVSSVQMHSRKHSKTCKKKGTPCRFNFPRPPSNQTFISKPQPNVSCKNSKKNIS
ncbi:uncharacterized protein LOC118559104 [Fundulus heteroclitus]|uniref:uncharacterized protein LOC118559104 n=1 Tax=Fundulus heteroclitus TaxID=8078 RepID=UPI00165C33E4|nr:uncharacterized protein LOC118559104 [Fundulus heteroclitus]